jgi:hypothetical protein
MAIVQVSRITNRKGLTENLPQLAGAELGWCVDSRRLFIGNGTLQEGAPVIGNTEILTEFSDITTLSSYIYQDSTVGYTAQTGPSAGDPVVRTVQARLDDYTSVRNYGAVGDGVADDTDAINRALFDLYCRANNTQIRRSLFFPAGTYRVSNTILIPTYAKLMGEGADCSIILLDPQVPSVPNYVAQYADNLQQTGVNIGNNGATAPRNIEISSMTFQTAIITDVFLVEDATQCYFDSVNFRGPLTETSITGDLATDNIAGVRFASTTNFICSQITFDKCRFSGLTYGLNTLEQTQGVTVSNSNFRALFQGVVLGDGPAINGGPTGTRIVSNRFDSIYAQGVVFGNITLNVSAHNVFFDVANSFSGVGSPSVPVISIGYDNNVSVYDMFERTNDDNNVVPRIAISGSTTTTGSSTSSSIQLGRYTRTNGATFAMTTQVSPQPIFTVNATDVRAFRMDYTVVAGATVRTGTLIVVDGTSDDSTSSTAYTDDYVDNFDTGVVLGVSKSLDNISVNYTSSGSATLTYSLEYLA